MSEQTETIAPHSPVISHSSPSSIPSSVLVNESQFDCPICLELLYDPITLPACGHTLCRQCAHLSINAKPVCPSCRAPCINLDLLSFPTTHFLSNFLSCSFPSQWAARQADATARKRMANPRYGIFVANQVHFPGQSIRLHIFEPQYRVLVNRALATTRKFVIVAAARRTIVPRSGINMQGNISPPGAMQIIEGVAGSAAVVDERPVESAAHADDEPPLANGLVGCLVKITNCRALFDGRSFVEAVGVDRVRLSNTCEEENGFGLLSGEAERLVDEEEKEEQQQQEGSEEEKAQAMLGRLREIDGLAKTLRTQLDAYCQSAHISLDRLESLHGAVPLGPSEFAYWIAQAIPASNELKRNALEAVSLLERLEVCSLILEAGANESKNQSQSQQFIILIIVLLALASIFNR